MSADIDRSKIGRTSRARGGDAERRVVNYLRDQGWPDARRYLAGDGRQPGDIDWHPLIALEVKDRADSTWPTWCRQALREARTGMVPIVVRRTRGAPDVGMWECRVDGVRWATATDSNAFLLGDSSTLVDEYPWIISTFGRVSAAIRSLDAPAPASVGGA